MKKLMMVLVAGCMSAAVAGAYAATGSPADTDKAGRAGPGTGAGQMGANDPTPGGKAGSATGAGASSRSGGATSSTGAGAGGSMGAGASSSSTSGGAAASSSGADEPKAGRRSRRAARAEKG